MKKLRTHRSSESTGQMHEMEWEKPWCQSRHSPALWASSDKGAMKRKGEQGRWRVSGKWCPRQLSTHVRKMDRVCGGSAYLGHTALHIRLGNHRWWGNCSSQSENVLYLCWDWGWNLEQGMLGLVLVARNTTDFSWAAIVYYIGVFHST